MTYALSAFETESYIVGSALNLSRGHAEERFIQFTPNCMGQGDNPFSRSRQLFLKLTDRCHQA